MSTKTTKTRGRKAGTDALAIVRENLARIDATEQAIASGQPAPTDEIVAVASANSPKPPPGKGKKTSAKKLKAVAAADQENARARDERKASPDGMSASERAMAKSSRAKGDKPAKTQKPAKPKRMSALDAAAKVLAESKEPMRAQDLVKAMAEKGLWKSPAGKTPHATLYAAMIREIKEKGKDARFKKADRGLFTLSAAKVET